MALTSTDVPRTADQRYQRLIGFEADNSEKARARLIALCVVTPLMLLFLVLFLGEYLQAPVFEPLIQVVQVQDGEVVMQSPPQKLLEWQPAESQIHDMLSDWIRHFYSRSTDPDTHKVNQHWVDRHTCGPAVAHLRVRRQTDTASTDVHRKVQVGVKQVQKTPAPRQYHVVWQEIETYAHQEAKTPVYSSVMTVGRLKPTDREWYMWNKSGLCVDAFSQKELL